MQTKEETVFDLYIRVSSLGDRTEEKATETYEAQCHQTAQRLHLEWDEIVSETNVSGSTHVADRELERLIQKIENGESEGIIVPWTDRFARDVIEGNLAYRRIALAGGRLIGAMDGLDSASPGNKETFGYRMVNAEAQLDRARENFHAGVDGAVARRAYIYKTPFGYRKDDAGRLVIDEADAKLVRELFERRAAGENLGQLLRWFNGAGALNVHQGKDANGEPNPPKPFTKNGIAGLLRNRAYLGEMSRQQRGKKGQPKVEKDYHPPIVTENEFNAANSVKGIFYPRDSSLADQARLRGLVYCSTCGKRVKVNGSTTGGQRVANYCCTGDCERRAGIRASVLDAYISNLLLRAAVAKEPHIAAVIDGDTRYQDALDAVAQAQRLHDELRDDMDAQAVMGTKDFIQALKIRKEAITTARRALAKVKPADARKREPDKVMTAEEFIAEYERETDARFIDRIVLKPATARGRKPTPVEDRVDLYLAGSDKPYVPTFGKVSKKLQAQIDAHISGEDRAIIDAIDARQSEAVS